MVEAPTVRKRLGVLEERLRRLRDLSSRSMEEFLDDVGIQDRVERNLQVAIQAAVDLGLHILVDFPGSAPDAYRLVFRQLGKHGLIRIDLAERLERMAGFRNVLVHAYADVVPEQVYRNLAHLPDLQEYVQQLSPYLREQGILPGS